MNIRTKGYEMSWFSYGCPVGLEKQASKPTRCHLLVAEAQVHPVPKSDKEFALTLPGSLPKIYKASNKHDRDAWVRHISQVLSAKQSPPKAGLTVCSSSCRMSDVR
jgi:hypothetical protein